VVNFTVHLSIKLPQMYRVGEAQNSSLPEEDQGSLLSPGDDRPESGKGGASDSEWPRENIEEFVLLPDDTLQSVLGRLNLSKHIPLFQVCHTCLQLMGLM